MAYNVQTSIFKDKETGELTIPGSDLVFPTPETFSATYLTLSSLQNDQKVKVGDVVDVVGRVNIFDQGGNAYEIIEDDGNQVDDGGSIIFLPASGHYAKGLFLNGVNVKQFGAFDDPAAHTSPDNPATTDQWQYFEAASNYAVGGIITVPKGRYRVAQPTTNPSFWLLEPGSTVTGNGRTRIGSYDRTSYLTGVVQHFNNRPAGGDGSPYSGSTTFRFGDPEPYESDFLGHSATAAISGIGRNGGVGVLSATRSSTNTAPSGTASLQVGAAFYGVQDNTENLNNVVTAAYTEATRMPGTATTFAQETTIKNFGDLVDVNALSPAGPAAGATGGIQLIPLAGPESTTASGSVDLTDWPTAARNHSSYAIGMIGQADEDGVGFNRGLLIFKGSIASNNAIDMYEDYNITWRSDSASADSVVSKDSIRLSSGGSTVAGEAAEHVFWRYRGTAVSRTSTSSQDILGRTSYHGHTDSAFGFSQATNPLVELMGKQQSALTGSNAVGQYQIRINDGAGNYNGWNFNDGALVPVGTQNIGTSNSIVGDIWVSDINIDGTFAYHGADNNEESSLKRTSQVLALGNSITTDESAIQTFWRYRGGSTSRTNTLSGDVVGRIDYRGHTNSTNGIEDATNPIAYHYVEQRSSPDASGNASGWYRVRVSDSAGNYTGFDFVPTGFRPTGDGSLSVGTAPNRLSEVYAVNGTIQTSDGRLKQDIETLNTAELAVAQKLKTLIRKFRFTDAVAEKGEDARIHIGVIAQDVIAAFEDENLDPFKYGIVCHDEWTVETTGETKDRYSVRYNELMAFIIAAL